MSRACQKLYNMAVAPLPLEGGGAGEGVSDGAAREDHPTPLPPPPLGEGVFDAATAEIKYRTSAPRLR